MTVGVVVVAFGRADLLAQALAPLTALPVVVVDNSSDPDVKAATTEAHALYVDPGSNLGFGAGANRGVRELWSDAGPCDVLVLNPDAVLLPADLSLLEACLSGDQQAGIAVPALVDAYGAEQRQWWNWPSPSALWREAVGLGRVNDRHQDWVTGAVMLIRAKAWEQVGPFDERFFLYQEETDWQRRAVLAGWRIRLVPGATAQHAGAGTSSDSHRREALFHAGTETYIRKWFGARGWSSYRTAALLGALIRGVVLPGDRGRAARGRAALYWRGPRRAADLVEEATGAS